PVGTACTAPAIKKQNAEPAWSDAAIASMTTLNKAAAEVIRAGSFAIHAMTDVTGFGLIGHLREMCLGSGVSARIHAKDIPLLPGAIECVRAGFIPGGLNANRDFAECNVAYENGIDDTLKPLLFDPQTARALLIPVVGASLPC